jgi:uncharacterized protein
MFSAGLITGASSGIGLELAKIHASKGENIIIVARRKELLEQLQKEISEQYSVKVIVFAIDLTEVGAAKRVYEFTKSQGIFVDYLFNNAGFGTYGKFTSFSVEKHMEMVQLNIRVLVELSHYYLKDMEENNSGKILNTSSTAGFLPSPYFANYFATKAYVNSFSQSLSYELRHTKITVIALCPGPVKTGFAKVAGLEDSKILSKGTDAYSTALKGYNGMMRGKRIVISSFWLNITIKLILPFVPKSLLLKTMGLKFFSKDKTI